MKQQTLNGYILHQRAYQEKRAIYQFFSYEFGVVHGIGVRGMPLFTPLHLMATGKNSLKSFSQMTLGFAGEFTEQLGDEADLLTAFRLPKGQMHYALLYMNEVLYKLLALENACPSLWHEYHAKTQYLLTLAATDGRQMRLCLRQFERALFAELGVMIDYAADSAGEPIAADVSYHFIPEMGFVPMSAAGAQLHAIDATQRLPKGSIFRGEMLQIMANAQADSALFAEHLAAFGQLQRELMDYLLEYKPLHSRTLWQQSRVYR